MEIAVRLDMVENCQICYTLNVISGSFISEKGQIWAKKEGIIKTVSYVVERANEKTDDIYTHLDFHDIQKEMKEVYSRWGVK